MIFDKESLLSDAQAITATAVSTNYIDTGAKGTPYGGAAALAADVGKSMVPILVQVVEAFNTLTTLVITLETDDNTSFSSATVVHTQTLALADLVVGKSLNIDYVPKGVSERYFRLNYTVTGTDPTLGQITAGVTMGNQTNGSNP